MFAASLRRKCRDLMLVTAAAAFSFAATASANPSFDPNEGMAKAQDIRPADVILWEAFDASPIGAGRVEVGLRMSTKQGFTVYKSNLSFHAPTGFQFEAVEAPASQRQLDPISGQEVDVYAGGDFKVTFVGPADWSAAKFPMGVRYVGCTQVICLFPYTQELDVPVRASLEKSAAEAASPAAGSVLPSAEAATPAIVSTDVEPSQDALASDELDLESRLATTLGAGGSLWIMFLVVFAGGLLSNLTPCVYPMIPITLRVLARQGRSPYVAALAYALGIVVTYTALGLVAALSGGMFGQLLASKTFNVCFAIFMAILGLSMLGIGDMSKLQALGSRLGSGPPSPRNALLMGAGAGLVAAPCTGPILAALLAYTAKSEAGLTLSSLLMVCYSAGFALPYVALGGAAAKASSIRVPPALQVGIKLAFASVMFALALYYLRIPFYALTQSLEPHWQTLALIGLIGGAILMAVWLLAPRLAHAKLSSAIPTLVMGLGIFAAVQWATTTDKSAGAGAKVTWYHGETEAFEAARKTNRPILIDMWATWCEACKKMDRSTFIDAGVTNKLAHGWIALKLDLSESTDANDALQEKYKLQSLPTLVLVPPDGNLSKMQAITGYVGPANLSSHLDQFSRKLE